MKYFRLYPIIFCLVLSQPVFSFSVSSAVSGAISYGTLGPVSDDTLIGINGGVVPTQDILDGWDAEYTNLIKDLGISNNEFYNRIQADITKLVLDGLETLGFDYLTEEYYWQAYKAFSHRISKGSTQIRPSAQFLSDYAENFQRYFRVNISNVKFYTTPNPPASDNAFADCQNIYFPQNMPAVSLIRDNNLTDNDALRHTLHELKHSDQCSDLGSRREYGIYWIKNIIATGLVNPEDLLKVSFNGFDFTAFHDKMPMEIDAEEHAKNVQAANGSTINVTALVSPKVILSTIVITTGFLLN